MSFNTPSTLSLSVSSLSTPHFATSYSLSTIGVIDGSVSYLYSTLPLNGVAASTPALSLRRLVRGYRDLRLPLAPPETFALAADERKPTLLHATLMLPPPSTLTAIYSRLVNPRTLCTVSIHSKSIRPTTPGSSPPPASILIHAQHDTGRYRIEGLGSTDSALLGLRGLWNFGMPSEDIEIGKEQLSIEEATGEVRNTSPLLNSTEKNNIKPSLLSAGAEVYYSPLSSVIGLSTGLRFTTLPAAPIHPSQTSNKPMAGTSAALSSYSGISAAAATVSSFPYTMTLTLTPLTGSLASTYSIKPTKNFALSSRFGFNVYSWESEYVFGGEIWRRRPRRAHSRSDDLQWARAKASQWLDDAKASLGNIQTKDVDTCDEAVFKFRVDDNWRFKALWTGRIKDLLVSAGFNVFPALTFHKPSYENNGSSALQDKKWTGSLGVEVAYSSGG